MLFVSRWVKLDMRTGANISVATFDDTSDQVLVGPVTLEDEGDRDDVVLELEKLHVDYDPVNCNNYEEYLGCYHHEWNLLYSNITWIGDANSPERYVGWRLCSS